MENSELVHLIKKHLPEVKLIYLFGSRATNEDRPGSDWDVAIMNGRKIPKLDLWQIQERVADELGSDVDLIDVLQSSTVLNIQIIEHGKLLYGESSEALAFETKVLSMYGHLQEQRQDVIEGFVERLKGAHEG